jgi:hypothetical protein
MPRITLGRARAAEARMERSEAGRSAPAGTTAAKHAMPVAAWRQLWRLLPQPTGDEPLNDEAASDQEAAIAETYDYAVDADHLPPAARAVRGNLRGAPPAWPRGLSHRRGGAAMTTPMLQEALAAHKADLCVVPPRQDGSKRPIGASWQQWQKRRPPPCVIRTRSGTLPPGRPAVRAYRQGTGTGRCPRLELLLCCRRYGRLQ